MRPGYDAVVDALRSLVEASAQAVGLKAMPIAVYLSARRVLDDVDAADRQKVTTPDEGFDAMLMEIGVMPHGARRS